jgi:putative protease
MAGDAKQKPELLAPAGSISVFEMAINAGADAVYIGAPSLNARAQSRDFSPAEIAAMIQFAHEKGVKLYLAANSLLKENEIPLAVETLAMLEALQADALIIQDLGIYQLCRRYFPGLRIHASTLLGAHNSLGVLQFQKMGFERVVLARELTIQEIGAIARQSRVELEVFIHGALCFSYSGLCLFSSYLGGKSGLRGRCVQPCRRRYSWSQKGQQPGYFFSMNDLSSIDLVHKLAKAGVSSLKIEGRLRSAHYVSSVVKAYRLVIDAAPGDPEALRAARELLDQAMGRKTSQGYFSTGQAKDLIAPYHSGNIGMYLGQAGKGTGRGRVVMTVKQTLQTGDRLRLHQEETGERVAFTLRSLTQDDRKVSSVAPGESVILEVPARVKTGDSLFKVDSREAREAEREESVISAAACNQMVKKLQRRVKRKVAAINSGMAPESGSRRRAGPVPQKRGRNRVGIQVPLYFKVDDLQVLKLRLPLVPELFLVELNRKSFADLQRLQKTMKKIRHKVAWCLPPVILENELSFFGDAIEELLRKNFRTWQIAHIGQSLFFAEKARITLLGDYTLNILNSLGLQVLASLQLQKAQVAIETDKKSLAALLGSRSAAGTNIIPGMTLYGTPPLFTARSMAPHFRYEQPFVSPKGEIFSLRQGQQSTLALADKPFSLLSRLPELARLGVRYGVIDLCHRKIERRELDEIGREVSGKGARRKLSTFNYFGELL